MHNVYLCGRVNKRLWFFFCLTFDFGGRVSPSYFCSKHVLRCLEQQINMFIDIQLNRFECIDFL